MLENKDENESQTGFGLHLQQEGVFLSLFWVGSRLCAASKKKTVVITSDNLTGEVFGGNVFGVLDFLFLGNGVYWV